MPSADDISGSIEPGSLEYGDRQVVEDRIQQAVVQKPTTPAPGARSAATQQRLQQGPVSDLPVTSGLSVGPGAGPANLAGTMGGPNADQLRLVAEHARSPVLRQLARDAIRAEITRGS